MLRLSSKLTTKQILIVIPHVEQAIYHSILLAINVLFLCPRQNWSSYTKTKFWIQAVQHQKVAKDGKNQFTKRVIVELTCTSFNCILYNSFSLQNQMLVQVLINKDKGSRYWWCNQSHVSYFHCDLQVHKFQLMSCNILSLLHLSVIKHAFKISKVQLTHALNVTVRFD